MIQILVHNSSLYDTFLHQIMIKAFHIFICTFSISYLLRPIRNRPVKYPRSSYLLSFLFFLCFVYIFLWGFFEYSNILQIRYMGDKITRNNLNLPLKNCLILSMKKILSLAYLLEGDNIIDNLGEKLNFSKNIFYRLKYFYNIGRLLKLFQKKL